MNTEKIVIFDGEYWYGGAIDETEKMPYDRHSSVRLDTEHICAFNQVSPMLVSTKGRYVYCRDFYHGEISDGTITLFSEGEIDFGDKGSLKEAYRYLKEKYYHFDGRYPDERLFRYPQYCTWIALGFDQTQEKILNYARSIRKAGLPAGEIIIDDGWTNYMGEFDFNFKKVPDPKGLCDQLKSLGFFVSVWVTPYISPDTTEYRNLLAKGCLVMKGSEPFISSWWNGYSACLDFSNPSACEWFDGKVRCLKEKYGVEGVKMDAGDPRLYEDGLVCYGKQACATANAISECYGKLATGYLSEIRSTVKCEGFPVMQRIADRFHVWEDGKNGFDGIVKKALIMSLAGYPYNCPDMIGGGQIADVIDGTEEDEELNMRYVEAAVFMPSLQFSKPLWEREGKTREVVLKMIALRERYAEYIVGCVRQCAESGEPIIRTMDYAYGVLEGNTEQFMFGERLLVSPVMKKGQKEKKVFLPRGRWSYVPDGSVYDGGQTVCVSSPVDVLPLFEKIS